MLLQWDQMRQMQDIFERYMRTVGQPQTGTREEVIAAGDWTPRVDIVETGEAFVIRAEIPDVNKEDVKVTLDKGILTIRGERKQEKEEDGKKFHRVERHYGVFTRSFTLPDNVDETKITALYKDGTLNLEIQKTEKVKPKAIEVKVE